MSTKVQTLENILLAKWEKKELAHFYLLQANELTQNKSEVLDLFLFSFFAKVLNLSSVKKEQILSHPDFFFMGSLEREENYKVDELSELMRFNELAPQLIKHKFLVIYHAHLLSRDMYNKLLKLLEEPNKRSTIFLINDRGIELMPTIRSRALQLKLPLESKGEAPAQKNQFSELLNDFLGGKFSLNGLVEKVKTEDGKTDEALTQAILDLLLQSEKEVDFEKLQELSTILQQNRLAEAFNNARALRLFQLAAYAQKSL